MKIINFLLLMTISLILSCSNTNNISETNITDATGDGWSEYNAAKSYLESGQKDKAKKQYEIAAKKIAQSGASDINSYIALGNSNYYIENYEKAQYYWGEVLKIDANNDEAICKMGKTKYNLEFYDEATEYLQKCYNKSSEDPELSFLVASSSQKADRGVNKNILELYQKSANKGYIDAILQLAEIYRYNKYDERALTQYRKYIDKGGKLDRDAQDWFNSKQPQVAMVDNSSSNSVENPINEPLNFEPVGKEEVLMVCPFCGRLGEKGTNLCNFDGEPLQELQ